MGVMIDVSHKCACAMLFLSTLAGCADVARREAGPTPAFEPGVYRSLAASGAVVDELAARDMISLYRQNNGRGVLAIDPELQRFAREEAEAMARRASPDHGRRAPIGVRLRAAGLERAHAVDSVSAGYHTLAEAFSGWRQSPPHNEKMLDRRIGRMGIATAYAPGAKYKVFWTLILTD
jgi:uncharacterized protein YkwD